MKKIISLIGCLWLVLLFNTAHATIETAEEVIMGVVDVVLERLNTEQEALHADPSKIYGLVNEVVKPHFDFVSMSKWVLGKKNWRGASEKQREQFIAELRTLLIRTYGKALLEYSGQSIEYLPTKENSNSNLIVVKTKIHQNNSKEIPIDYRMHISGGQWKIVDIVVNGLSLVSTYRVSFASEIKKNGFDALVSKLSHKNKIMMHLQDNTATN